MNPQAKEDVEEAAVDAYAEASLLKPSDSETIAYLRKRLEDINTEYKTLKMIRAESEATGNKQILQNIMGGFRENFKVRKYVVAALRKMGQPVDDPFVPKEG